MAHNPEWHAEYRRLENEELAARMAFRAAQSLMDRKRRPTDAQARYDAALDAFRAAGQARWDYEMAATKIVDIATLPPLEWAASLRSR